ncbi:Predicted nucleic acid-binding protein, contains PIN domain [Algoriphagus locisalis]|uniref:Predicted nucleic acid-binding protein, contains PIN domain n=1 Tax=Algoriphagus locisalis TaxID=305507 RepID=A0A1I6ZQA5_9BACT|nr:PIN domain-containing protein [Algoriphagus locisalis]SFT64775.1 Predicted nucleic acid-binding protein, contains PIN domain [Algoriphagus locisalis]
MKVFLDANVIISVLNKEYPLFPISSRVLSLADRGGVQLYTSPICLAISFYFSEKKSGSDMAKLKIEMLSKKLLMTAVDQETVSDTLSNRQVQDFEDGLEYYSALGSECEVIVTEDSDGFYYSQIPVLGCEKFLEEYIF